MIKALFVAALLLQEGLPPRGESWRSLPWHVTVLEARAQALRDKQPVYLWAAVGHPLGAGSGHVIIDRTVFRDARVSDRIRKGFVPVAVDQTYQRNQHDAEGDFYRSIVVQG